MKLKRTDLICCIKCEKKKQARRFAKARTETGYKDICKFCCKVAMKIKLRKSNNPRFNRYLYTTKN